MVSGKKILQMRPRLMLLLPNALEVKRYKSRLFGRQNTKFEYDPEAAKNPMPPARTANFGLVRAESTQVLRGVPTQVDGVPGAPPAVPVVDAATQKRRENIEAMLGSVNKQQKDVQADGRIRYVCRLGDTLRSLAMRHPALKDHTLWRLVAEVNGLSTETDDKGNPVAELKRGTSIVLPSAEEITRYRESAKGDSAAVPSRPVVSAPITSSGAKTMADAKPSGDTTSGIEIVCKPCPQCKRLTTMNATICPACAFPFEGQRAVTELIPESDRTVPVPRAPQPPAPEADAAVSLLLAAGMKPVPQAEKEADRGIRNVIAPISETCRIVSFGNMDDTGVGFRTRLEVRQEEFWLPVVRYEINEDASWRHTFNLGGTRKTTRIDLPSRAAKEMAEHDLTANAEKYAEAFLKGVDINDVV
jgi:hypothetical protein